MAPLKAKPPRDEGPHARDAMLDLRFNVPEAHAAVHVGDITPSQVSCSETWSTSGLKFVSVVSKPMAISTKAFVASLAVCEIGSWPPGH